MNFEEKAGQRDQNSEAVSAEFVENYRKLEMNVAEMRPAVEKWGRGGGGDLNILNTANAFERLARALRDSIADDGSQEHLDGVKRARALLREGRRLADTIRD